MPVKPVPDGYHTVTPYLMLKGAGEFIAFMQTVFGAEVIEQLMRVDGKIGHTELRLGDSVIMLNEVPDGRTPTTSMLHLYIEDVDAAFGRAVVAGATIVAAPADQFYGDRSAAVIAPGGTTIWIATHIEDVAPAELQRRLDGLNRS